MAVADFLIVGAQKAGTTTLHHHLSGHPDLFLPRRKEIHFFDTRRDLGPADLARYARVFDDAGPGRLCGEATPIYMVYPGCLARIRRLLGPIRIVISLRDPVNRAYSHYWHEYKNAWEDRPFEQALRRRPRGDDDELHLRHHSYLERSCYSAQIAEAEAIFGADNVKIVRFEDLTQDPLAVVNGVIAFLRPGAAPLRVVSREARNEAKMPRSRLVHRLMTHANLRLGRSVTPRHLAALNLRTARYPTITPEQRALCRDLLLDRDPGLTQLYPGL